MAIYTDEELMAMAIELAEQCQPIHAAIPRVGAVIAKDGKVLATGFRGTGKPDDDDHAEKRALDTIPKKRDLPKSTLYTTLEPCTPEVRSKGNECCSKLIEQARIRRVFIGILDPNQGVTGKGLWQLQDQRCEVSLFPHEMAEQIRVINRNFILSQQNPGIKITSLTSGQKITDYVSGTAFELRGTYTIAPTDDIYAVIAIGGKWWPQPLPLTTNGNEWTTKVYFGSGDQVVLIVRAKPLGNVLFKYYQKIRDQNLEKIKRIRGEFSKLGKDLDRDCPDLIAGAFPPFDISNVPKGLEILDEVGVHVTQHDSTLNLVVNPRYESDLKILDGNFQLDKILDSETILIITGSTLVCELLDRPTAAWLRNKIDSLGKGKSKRRAVVINDSKWLSDSSLAIHPAISIGGPHANKATLGIQSVPGSQNWKKEHTNGVYSERNQVPAVALWGGTALQSRQAVEAYFSDKQGLRDFLKKCWK